MSENAPLNSHMMDAIMNNLSVGVIVRHIQMPAFSEYLLFNKVAKEFYECDNVFHSPHWNQPEEDRNDEQAALLDKPFTHEWAICNEQGDVKRWLISTKKKIDIRPNEYYIITTLTDITSKHATERALEQKHALLESMFDNIPVGIEIFNKNQEMIEINRHELETLGLSRREDILGVTVAANPNLPQEMKDKIANGEKFETTIEYNFGIMQPFFGEKSAEMGLRYFNILAAPVRTCNGEVDSYLFVNQDVTHQKQRELQLKENEAQQRKLNEALREKNLQLDMALRAGNIIPIVWDIDSEMVLIASPEIKSEYDLFDKSRNGLRIDELLEFVHPDDRQRTASIFSDIRSGRKKFVTEEFRYDIQQRYTNYFESNFILLEGRDGRPARVYGYMQDITERKQLLNDLREAKEKAEQSDNLKSAFLANMSHEIRTPLNAIVGFSELLLVESPDEEEKQEYVRIISLNNELMLRLINDILDLSKIESGILERTPEQVNLALLSHDIYTSIQGKIMNPSIDFIFENPYAACIVKLDPHRLRQVWNNFLTNAIKHTKFGHIRMGYSCENHMVRIYVEDTGSGIPEELHSRVFGRFQKLNEFVQGTGLGLAICKAIIEAAGGSVGFTSHVGQGSTFWAMIPCEAETVSISEAAATPPIPPAAQTPEFLSQVETRPEVSHKLHILIAEDNDSNYLLVKHLLKEHRLVRALNGVQAIELVQQKNFDLILMDMNMPIMGGIEATKAIRQFNTQIPIIALTASAFDSDRALACSAGCNGFLTKPLKRKELLKAINICSTSLS